MIKIGITGQSGFIGTHLFNRISLLHKEFSLIDFKKSFFSTENELNKFVSKCDVIFHLAGLNRHEDENKIFNTNINLTKKIISAAKKTKSAPHIIFTSSIQEEHDNLYGLSKKKCSILFQDWIGNTEGKFTSLIIPNVFGPFCKPYYNSVVATFCHQLTNNLDPQINTDSKLKLIYIDELVDSMISAINQKNKLSIKKIKHTYYLKVSELLFKLSSIKNDYLGFGVIPNLENVLIKNLFNTLLTYINYDQFFPFNLKINSDDRGSFVETMKLNTGGQISFSTTLPGIKRGEHFHTHKAERFAVIKGKAKIEIRRIGKEKKYTFYLDGQTPSFVDMPVWYTHNITNIGDEELYTLFWTNELYNPKDPDTYYKAV